MEQSSSASAAELKLYREIRRAIAERRLEPGVKLAEDALATLFKVSRARVRKVLLLLAKDHIVTHKPNRGAFVWRPSIPDAKNVLQARRLVECFLVRQAAVHRTKAQLKELRSIILQEHEARKAGDKPRTMRLSGEFHIALAKCAGNPILSEFLAGLISRSYLILAVYQRNDAESCPQDDHKSIIDHLENGNTDAAEAMLNLHFDHIEDELNLSGETEYEKVDLGMILQPE